MLPILATLPLAGAAPLGSWSVASAPDLQAVIDQATAPMNFLTRPIARSRLKATNSVYRTVRIEREAGHRFVTEVVEAFPGEIESVSVSKPTLEDVFIRRTGHRFWNEDAQGLEQQAASSAKKKKKKH